MYIKCPMCGWTSDHAIAHEELSEDEKRKQQQMDKIFDMLATCVERELERNPEDDRDEE